MGYKFTSKALRILNNGQFADLSGRLEFLGENFAELLLVDAIWESMLNDLSAWLEQDVQQSKSGVEASAKVLHGLVTKSQKDLKSRAGEDEARVARFLVEVLRTYNFAHHDGSTIRKYVEIFADLEITVAGDPENCAKLATFEGLGYVPNTGVVMNSGV